MKNGDSIASEGKGDYLYMSGRILDVQGNPIAGAVMDIWEADQHGVYDMQVGVSPVITMVYCALTKPIASRLQRQTDCRGRPERTVYLHSEP